MKLQELDGLLKLNKLALTEDEQNAVLAVFDNMENEEQLMRSVNTDNIDIMVHVMPMTNVFREDVRVQPFSRESLLAGAPEHSEDSWEVPRLVK